MSKIYVYWHGVIGIPGKGPHWMGAYDPNMTIGQIIQKMEQWGYILVYEKLIFLDNLYINLMIIY